MRQSSPAPGSFFYHASQALQSTGNAEGIGGVLQVVGLPGKLGSVDATIHLPERV